MCPGYWSPRTRVPRRDNNELTLLLQAVGNRRASTRTSDEAAPVLQIVYISTSRVPLTPLDVDQILSVSRRNNTRDSISGLLLSSGHRFLQALEGPEAAVRAAYRRIAADPRHFAIVQLGCCEIEERQFGAWAMSHLGGGSDNFLNAAGSLTERVTDPNLKAQFTGFAQLHARAA